MAEKTKIIKTKGASHTKKNIFLKRCWEMLEGLEKVFGPYNKKVKTIVLV